MPAGARGGSAFMSARLNDPLRRLPQIMRVFMAMAVSLIAGCQSDRLFDSGSGPRREVRRRNIRSMRRPQWRLASWERGRLARSYEDAGGTPALPGVARGRAPMGRQVREWLGTKGSKTGGMRGRPMLFSSAAIASSPLRNNG